MKSKITLYVCDYKCSKKEKIELYDFSKLDHCFIEGRSYVRVLCGNKFYYYPTHLTAIGEITIEGE